MTPTFVFATDLSADNRAGFARALRLAYAQHAQLDILHVLDPYLPRRLLRELEQAVNEDIATTLTDIREDYALEAPKTVIQTVMGEPHVEVVRKAHEQKAELIVLGMHRKRGQKELLAGTTFMRILRCAPCPVVIVQRVPTQPWQHILVPVDSFLTVRQTLSEALRRFPEAKITLLHAWTLPGEVELGSEVYYARWREQEVARLQALLSSEVERIVQDKDGALDIELVLESGTPSEVVQGYIKQHTPDVVMIGSRGQPYHSSQLTQTLLSEPHCDLILCRAW
ncbi:universal stress protein [Vreelandella nanhaiensis]|uniref:Universal stress protein n=1 Tax=Vreelandella nanhaiensis TaxID=1258546 RepID=A0A433KNV0_9GAMM|nr:universal stress protein [Halomonas nanhaiensis]RUR31271.1 universal stress protein [Halomonas nanhaiensis]